MEYKNRKVLPHQIPSWVEDGADYFITICCHARGSDQLCTPDIANKLRASFFHYQQEHIWWIHLLLLMPDHLHAIISFNRDPGMKKAVTQWKRYVANTLQIKWQRGFFDHRLRQAESFLEKANYIRQNPVRAGLVQNAEMWPHCWTFCGR